MVYLAGDNNLTSECMFALTEMKKAALGKEVNVIAQFDPSDPYLPTHRYHINRSSKRKDLYYDIVDCARYYKTRDEVNFKKESSRAKFLADERKAARKAYQARLDKTSLTAAAPNKVISDDTDTGSPVTLYNFISYCIDAYPAHRYMVVLSGHAAGTERDYLLKDESSARSLTFNEMKQVFKRVKSDRQGKKIDIVGMDNCLMSMAEICYELRGLAEIVVGCESFSPTTGWPYRQILERLNRDFVNPALPKGHSVNAEAAKAIVEEYANYYSTYWMSGLSVTQSALDLTKVERLRTEVNKLGQLMKRELIKESGETIRKTPKQRPFTNSLLLAHWETQSYNGEQFVDVYDLCECLEARVNSPAVIEQCRKVKQVVENEFVLKSCYSGAAYQYSYGVSMYFPWAQVAPSYWNLDFVKDKKTVEGWGSFLEVYTALTRRLPRGWRTAPDAAAISNASTANAPIIDHAAYRIAWDRMGLPRNRVYSMRNPPDVFFPSECIRDAENAMKTQKLLRLR